MVSVPLRFGPHRPPSCSIPDYEQGYLVAYIGEQLKDPCATVGPSRPARRESPSRQDLIQKALELLQVVSGTSTVSLEAVLGEI